MTIPTTYEREHDREERKHMSRRSMVLQAIVTKYLGPSNVRGSRIKATAAAAEALANKFGWKGRWYQGGDPGAGYVFVCVDGDPAFITHGRN